MLDLDAAPTFVQILGHQPPVAVVGPVLTAQQAAFVQHYPAKMWSSGRKFRIVRLSGPESSITLPASAMAAAVRR